MASGCKVDLKRFEWDPAGYTAVKSSGGVQAVLAPRAEAVRARADAMGGKHSAAQRRARFDLAWFVRADDFRARYEQAKNKALTKALGAGGS